MGNSKSSAPVYIANLCTFFAIGFLNLAIVKANSFSIWGLDINEYKSFILISLPGLGLVMAHYLCLFLSYVSRSKAEKDVKAFNKEYKETCIRQLADPLLSEEAKEKIKIEYEQLSADERALANSNYLISKTRYKKADEDLDKLRTESPENNTGLSDMLKPEADKT